MSSNFIKKSWKVFEPEGTSDQYLDAFNSDDDLSLNIFCSKGFSEEKDWDQLKDKAFSILLNTTRQTTILDYVSPSFSF